MQVPSFDNKVAMTMVQQELGRPWQEVYSQLTPRPIAAASLGQVSSCCYALLGLCCWLVCAIRHSIEDCAASSICCKFASLMVIDRCGSAIANLPCRALECIVSMRLAESADLQSDNKDGLQFSAVYASNLQGGYLAVRWPVTI